MIVQRGLWRTLIAIGSLLVLGAVAGVSADRMLHREPAGRAFQMSHLRSEPLDVMDSVIDMRPEQRERVAAILETRQPAIDSVWFDTHVRLRTIIETLVADIAAVLDPDQAERFHQLVEELHSTPSGLPRH